MLLQLFYDVRFAPLFILIYSSKGQSLINVIAYVEGRAFITYYIKWQYFLNFFHTQKCSVFLCLPLCWAYSFISYCELKPMALYYTSRTMFKISENDDYENFTEYKNLHFIIVFIYISEANGECLNIICIIIIISPLFPFRIICSYI